jgi:hypothetical protein
MRAAGRRGEKQRREGEEGWEEEGTTSLKAIQTITMRITATTVDNKKSKIDTNASMPA